MLRIPQLLQFPLSKCSSHWRLCIHRFDPPSDSVLFTGNEMLRWQGRTFQNLGVATVSRRGWTDHGPNRRSLLRYMGLRMKAYEVQARRPFTASDSELMYGMMVHFRIPPQHPNLAWLYSKLCTAVANYFELPKGPRFWEPYAISTLSEAEVMPLIEFMEQRGRIAIRSAAEDLSNQLERDRWMAVFREATAGSAALFAELAEVITAIETEFDWSTGCVPGLQRSGA